MKLLQAEPEVAPAEPQPEAPARPCAVCGSGLAPDQDWCLECGAAQPGRLDQRPGWRAAMTVVGVTLLLVLGAVAASYAALTNEAEQVAQAPPGPSVAPTTQAPPSVPPAVPTTPPTEAPTDELPTVETPEADPGPSLDPVEQTPSPSPSPTPAPSQTTPAPVTTPAPTGPAAIAIDEEDGSLYDPYANALEAGDARRALDDDAGTSWLAKAAEDADTLAFGYVIDLGTAKAIEELTLSTKTPGFRVEIYASSSRELPPDVLDDRWVHVRDRNDVDSAVGASPKDGNKSGDGRERVVLGEEAEGKKFRHVLLWFTQIPENGPAIRLTEVSLKG